MHFSHLCVFILKILWHTVVRQEMGRERRERKHAAQLIRSEVKPRMAALRTNYFKCLKLKMFIFKGCKKTLVMLIK